MIPAAVVYDNLSEFARECLGVADDAVAKAASLEGELQEARKAREPLVLTKVAEQEVPISRVASTVDRLINTSFVKRANRSATIEGIRSASKEELFSILEKLASIAVCPVSALQGADDGELVEKAAGKTTDDSSSEDDVWTKAWKEAGAEVGA